MRIRAMTEEDATGVAALAGQLGYPAGTGAIAARFRALARDADAALLVAEAPDRALAGWIHVCGRRSLETDPFAEIAGLVVDSARRRAGIGRRLVEAAEDWAQSRGYDRLRVRSNVARAEAHDFYGGIGFNRAKTQHVYERSIARRR